MRIEGIQPNGGPAQSGFPIRPVKPGNIPSFKETLATFMNDVNNAQKVSGEMQQKLMAGETTDVHQVMARSEESNIAFNLLMEMRNKAVDAYNEIMRLRL